MKILITSLLVFIFFQSQAEHFSNPKFKLTIKEKVNDDSISQVFKRINSDTLKSYIDNNQLSLTEAFNLKLGNDIAEYIDDRYKIDIKNDVSDFPEATIVLGLFYFGKENGIQDLHPDSLLNRPADLALGCLFSAVGALLSIHDLRSLYQDFVSGIGASTILSTMKLMLRRVATVWTVVTTVYSFGDCMDWW